MWTGGYKLTSDDNSWGWSDGSAWNYNSWSEGEPNSIGKDHCVIMYVNELWNDIQCKNNRSFVCQQESLLPGSNFSFTILRFV